jgi:multiple sugar transport system substrate-binding protein
MNVLVNKMKPLTPKGSSNWFIDEVNAAINQGKVCIGLQWIGGVGVLDPKSSTLGKTKAQILDKLGFAPLPTEKTNYVPLGGMGMHISKYVDADHIAEAENFIKWFQNPDVQKKWAELGGVPGEKAVLASPEFLNATPYNKVFAESVSRVKDFWNLPEYAKLVNIESTNVNAALSGTESPTAALNKIASDQQAVLDASK